MDTCKDAAGVLPRLRVAFVDFLPDFDEGDNCLARCLSRHYELVTDTEQPQVVFFSCFGLAHLRYGKSVRIFYAEENVVPDFNLCDAAISPCRLSFGKRHLFFSHSRVSRAAKEGYPLPPLDEQMARRKFCSFIYSNAHIGEGSALRKEFCERLMEYAHVDCPGRILHNMDAPELSAREGEDWNASKIRFLSGYKFNIAFENSNASGYMTEKLSDAFMGNTVPIYWGSEGDIAPMPREAVIVANDYPNPDDLVERVREVNENDELYMAMLAANPLRHAVQMDAEAELEDFLLENVRRKPYEKLAVGTGNTSYLARKILTEPLILRVYLILVNFRLKLAKGEARHELGRLRRFIRHSLKTLKA